MAQTTANGNLVVSMTVQPTISIVFVNGTGTNGSCLLSGAGTSTATVNFGTASIASNSDTQGCVTYSVNGKTSYQLANTIGVTVAQSNSSSPSFTMAASLASAAPTGVTWQMHGYVNLTTSPQNVETAGKYGANTPEYLTVTVLSTVASGSLAQTINFQVTAN